MDSEIDIVILGIGVIILIWAIIKGVSLILSSDTFYKEPSFTPDDIARISRYLDNNTYYQNLSLAGKGKFLKRVISFMVNKEFEGRDQLQVTEEMKVDISASAVQLTFGLKEYRLLHYHTIRVYPKAFYSKIMNLHMKGGASPSGMIALSWKDFKHGYEDPDDKYNLGLHEMAHALKLDALKGNHFDARFENYLDNWELISINEFNKMKSGNKSFLRAYGGTNMHEFFAVCVEHFFEASVEFKKHLPDIYDHLCFLLNQDPIHPERDYSLPTGSIKLVNEEPESSDPEKLWRSFALKLQITIVVIIILIYLYWRFSDSI